MGFWDVTGDLVKLITPTVKRVGVAVDSYTSAAVTKINQVVGTQSQKLRDEYFPDDEKRAQIGLFTTTLAKNAGKYAVNEGFKHIPGATVASKLVSDTLRDVEQKNLKDETKSTSQPESSTQSSQDSVIGRSKIARSRM